MQIVFAVFCSNILEPASPIVQAAKSCACEKHALGGTGELRSQVIGI